MLSLGRTPSINLVREDGTATIIHNMTNKYLSKVEEMLLYYYFILVICRHIFNVSADN